MLENLEKFQHIVDEHYKTIDDLDNVITELKKDGASYIESMILLKRKTEIGLRELDEMFLNSSAWRSEKEKQLEFRNFLWDEWSKPT